MKLLLDENLPQGLRALLSPPHDVFTVGYLGWAETTNGALLKKAAQDGFDAVLTTDRGYEHQQNLMSFCPARWPFSSAQPTRLTISSFWFPRFCPACSHLMRNRF
ncbi:MAG TPA: DUF5615 family PIN-like protein [Tepidisphaeraceae bacterium]